MNNDYLWDKSGEPDLEVQELEEVLGTLRYQPKPLVLPENARMSGSRKWYPVLAIAATIALIALALGLWLKIQRKQISRPAEVAGKQTSTPEQQPAVPNESRSPALVSSEKQELVPNRIDAPKRNRAPQVDVPRQLASRDLASSPNSLSARKPAYATLARRLNRPQASRRDEQMTAANRAEAEAAKQQLMLALRVVSAKLSFAQRKTVPGNNNTRYQHKVG